MTLADGARRHLLLAGVVTAYIVAWCAYGVIAGSRKTASYEVIVAVLALAISPAGWLVSRRPVGRPGGG